MVLLVTRHLPIVVLVEAVALVLVDALPVGLVLLFQFFSAAASRREQVVEIQDDLLEHEHREEQITDIGEHLIDEGSRAHSQVAVKEAEGVTFLDH